MKIEVEAEKKIIAARVKLLLDMPFYGHLALGLEPEPKENMSMPTMATNGVKLYYDPEFVKSLTIPQLAWAIAHEVSHCALNHIPRREHRDHLRFNIASDFATNDLLKDVGFAPIKGALIPGLTPGTRDFIGKYAEYIYEKLPEPIVITVHTMDSHEEWSEWGKSNGGNGEGKEGKDKEEESASESKNLKSGSADLLPENASEGKGNGKENEDKNGLAGGSCSEKSSEEEAEEDSLEQKWRARVAQAATMSRMAGKMPGQWETVVGDLLQPKLDWRTILRDMITSCAKSDFRRFPPNKRHLWRGIYLPSLQGEEVNIAVAIDTSGSISDEEIREFLSEVQGICDSYQDYTIWLFACDIRITGQWELHPFDVLPKVMAGRGGTSFKPPLEEARKLPITTFVYLTDLEPNDGFPKQPYFPVIWVSVGDRTPPWGMLIKLPKGEKR